MLWWWWWWRLLIVWLRLSEIAHELVHDVYGDREDDSAVIFCRDTVESLQVSELESCWTVHNDLGSVSQSSTSPMFAFSSDHFSSGLSGSFSLSSHRSHQLLRHPDVL